MKELVVKDRYSKKNFLWFSEMLFYEMKIIKIFLFVIFSMFIFALCK